MMNLIPFIRGMLYSGDNFIIKKTLAIPGFFEHRKKGVPPQILEVIGDETNTREEKEVIPIYSIRQEELFFL
ncbi:hypothetical protein ACFSQ7_49465 [Paenibacillus rhizoplanae]